MKKLPLKALKMGVSGLQEKVMKARGHYDHWQAEIKRLSSAEAKQTYQPAKLTALKSEARASALAEIRAVKAGMAELVGPALAQRKRWSKAAMLRDTKFNDVPDYLRADRTAITQYELLNAVKELSTATRAARLSNEALLEALETAVSCDELATAAVLVNEAELRNDGKLKIQVAEVLKPVNFPESQEAEQAFTQMQKSLQEIDALEASLVDPQDTGAKSTVEFFAFNNRERREIQQPSAA